jgi:HEAT repeat protein
LTCLVLSGCANFWDDVTSRDFSFKGYFEKPNPLVVLRDSSDGDQRARALRALHEPQQYGGSKEDQDAILKILVTAASAEKQPLCRLAAIQSLGQFKDPRATQGLIEAYYTTSAFAPDTATVLRCEIVTSLGETGNPEGVELLAKVVQEPPTEGTDNEKQQSLDVRIAAARSLGKFKHYKGTEALVHVMQSEKDVALRDRAHDSLVTITGKDLPPDAKEWDQFLHQPQPGQEHDVAQEPARKKLFGWF